jgi:3-carboxy-cis,cis-muconate cycloisomerase
MIPATGEEPRAHAPFRLPTALFGDADVAEVFSLTRTVAYWLEVEVALAEAQAECGVIAAHEAEAIRSAARPEDVDIPELLRASRIIGYPILPLVRDVAGRLDGGRAARLHYGATTQDIMDTALALQLRDTLARMDQLVDEFGSALAGLVRSHRDTVMVARTHAQQAVPTTFGAKLAVTLTELARQRRRLAATRDSVAVVSLFGAGGTSAALGPDAARMRALMAKALRLETTDVPWHVARDRTASFGLVCGLLTGTCARFAREVIDLSRTEIGELSEEGGHHRGASSTMPQKHNPIASEAVIGMATTAGALASSFLRAMEAGHERAAGEWQIEWLIIPDVAYLTASALGLCGQIARGLTVFPDVMRRNLDHSAGFVMAEAYMMELAPSLGRETAHDLIYEAVAEARRQGRTLTEQLGSTDDSRLARLTELAPDGYLGDTGLICDTALREWTDSVREVENHNVAAGGDAR